jgi:hypothetical protein
MGLDFQTWESTNLNRPGNAQIPNARKIHNAKEAIPHLAGWLHGQCLAAC